MTVGRDATEQRARLTGDDLDGLLASLASGQSWADAAHMLLRQLAQTAGAQRAVLLMIDGPAHRLIVTHVLLCARPAQRRSGPSCSMRTIIPSWSRRCRSRRWPARVPCSRTMVSRSRPGAPSRFRSPLHRGSIPRVREADAGLRRSLRGLRLVPIGSERRRRVASPSPFAGPSSRPP